MGGNTLMESCAGANVASECSRNEHGGVDLYTVLDRVRLCCSLDKCISVWYQRSQAPQHRKTSRSSRVPAMEVERTSSPGESLALIPMDTVSA